jgi:hypothetical protein
VDALKALGRALGEFALEWLAVALVLLAIGAFLMVVT